MAKNIKLSKANIEDIIGLTHFQEGLLYHYISEPDNRQYYVQLSINISGDIKPEFISKAWKQIIKNNEILRAIYKWNKLENPVQIILKDSYLKIRSHDLSTQNESLQLKNIQSLLDEDIKEGINITEEPFRITLIKLAKSSYEMVITNHHIMYDGWSNGIILKEFINTYESLINNQIQVSLPKPQFKEFIKLNNSRDESRSKSYWQTYLGGIDSATKIITNVKDKPIDIKKNRYSVDISETLNDKINNFCRENKISKATFFYGAWGFLLQKYCNTDDVIFGTTVSGRTAKISGIENMVGLFINTLPYRVKRDDDTSIIDMLLKLESDLRKREDHEGTPLTEIKSYSDFDSRDDIFDSIVVIENYPLDTKLNSNLGSLRVNRFKMHDYTNYNLTLGIEDFNTVKVNLSYDNNKYSDEFISRMATHYENIMVSIVKNQDCLLRNLQFITNKEINNIFGNYNNTSKEYDNREVISKIIEAYAKSNPLSKAVSYEDKELTYGMLNDKANEVAHKLINIGIGKGDYIGVIMDRSIEVIIACLAIMKTGAAYSPIDINWPTNRIVSAIQDLESRVILVNREVDLPLEVEAVVVDSDSLRNKMPNPKVNIDLDDHIYVIFTSGSTGKPKGAINYYKGTMNRLWWMNDYFGKEVAQTTLMTANHVFDTAVWQMFWPLVNGGRTVIPPMDMNMTVEEISQLLYKEKITIADFVPSIFNALVHELEEDVNLQEMWKSLKAICYGGEEIVPSYINRLHKILPHIKNTNLYGPTETSIGCVHYQITGKEKYIPIGRPISNVEIIIIDKDGNLVPQGIPGELCISGKCVGAGYLRNPDKTKSVFAYNSFEESKYGVMYRTGDLALWSENRNIEYLGRIDHQVKIRGFRIETSEISRRLLAHDDVKEAAVIARDDSHDSKYLCAYFVSDKDIEPVELREFIKSDLPDYMVPAFFIQMENLPVSSSGKLNMRALPKPEEDSMAKSEYTPPRNEIESKMSHIWSQVLGVNKIGINDNFFELGGDSIKAIQITSRLKKEKLKLQIKDLFNNPTIAHASEYVIDENISIKEDYIGEIKLTPYQLDYLDIYGKEYIAQNDQFRIISRLKGFEIDILDRVVSELVKQHDILRSSFNKDGKWINLIRGIDDDKLYAIVEEDHRDTFDYEEKLKTKVESMLIHTNITDGPLFKLMIFKTRDGDKLVMTSHLLVMDDISWEIVLKDMERIYAHIEQNREVQRVEEAVSFREWTHRLEGHADSKNINKTREYWKNRSTTQVNEKETKVLEQSNKKQYFRPSNTNLKPTIDEANNTYNTHSEELLIAALSMTINQWGRDREVELNIIESDRNQELFDIDISNTVGCFKYMYPVNLYIKDNWDIGMIIKTTKENKRRVPNKGLDYGILQRKERVNDKTLKSKGGFSYSHKKLNQLHLKDFKVDDKNINVEFSNVRYCDIDITTIENMNQITILVNYNSYLYDDNEIKELLRMYEENIDAVINHCNYKDSEELTPSDFTAGDMSFDELEDVFSALEGN